LLEIHARKAIRGSRFDGRLPAWTSRTQIFTTNYDLAFELAASRTGFAVIDGFSHVSPQRFDSGFFDVDLAVRDRDRAATAIEWMPNVIQATNATTFTQRRYRSACETSRAAGARLRCP
jgi:hypothetical protein